LVTISFLPVQDFFMNRKGILIYYSYRAEAVRKADAVAIAADNPTVAL